MTTLKANKDNATFIGKVVEQGVGEQDWYQYQPVVKSKLSEIIVDALSSTNTSLVADLEASYPDVFPANGDTVYVRETGSDVVKSHVVSDVTDTLENGAWDVSSASFVHSFSVVSQESAPTGLFFKPDGTKMYVLGDTGNDVNEYNLSTAWNVSTASFVQSFAVGGQESIPTGLFFKPDGTKMYVTGTNGDEVNEYNLSTAWNISTASFVQLFSVAGQEAAPTGLFFKPDGTKMYVLGDTGNDVNEYNLSTAWNVSTASFVQSFAVGSQESNPYGLSFKPDGTKMYVTGTNGDEVNEYNLSTAWNISTASFVQSFSVAGQDAIPRGLFFKPNGTKMYVVGQAGQAVNEYTLPYQLTLDITSLSLSTIPSHAMLAHTPSVQVSAEANADRCLTEDMTLELVNATAGTYEGLVYDGYGEVVSAGDTVELTVSGSPVGVTVDGVSYELADTDYAITGIDFVQSFSVAGQDTNPTELFFKPDGTKMYVVGNTGDDINEYNLSTAWNVSTASFVQSFSVAGQETNPYGLFFKPDGTKMYVIGYANDNVNEYNLSTAWNVSTASFVQSFSVAGQDTLPVGLSFKPDGMKMYVVGNTGDNVYEYNLSSAWDVSTASFVQSFSVAAQDTIPIGLFFKPDGTKMYVVGSIGDNVNEYNLSTAWNVSTASFVQSLSVAGQDTSPYGLSFKPDGTKMYVVGNTGNDINEYNIISSTRMAPWQNTKATLTFANQAAVPTSAKVGARSVTIDADTRLYLSDGNLQTTYQTTIKPSTRAIQYRLGADNFTAINQLNVNLWKDV